MSSKIQVRENTSGAARMGDCHKQEHSPPSTYQYSWELQELPAPSANTALQEGFCRIRGHNESSRAPEEVRVGYQEKCLRVFLLLWHRLCRGGGAVTVPGEVCDELVDVALRDTGSGRGGDGLNKKIDGLFQS